jgi:sigma-B regulation protein RsbU (phosphoserine phosphatase)
MRDKIYLVSFLAAAGLLLYLGRGLLEKSEIATWGLTFGGTTAAAVLGMALYRVQLELRASRHELARKEAELNFALEVQQSLFPRQFPANGGLAFTAVCMPARGISGDYYDVLQSQDGRLIFAIADISGKGIPAAILMSTVHAALRILVNVGHPLGTVCSLLNQYLYQITEASRFATFFGAEWIPGERRLQYVNAGHNTPVLVGSQHGTRLECGGPPLGIFKCAKYEVGDVELHPGDLLVLYSDGVTEAGVFQGEEFGEARLENIAMNHREKPLAEIQRRILMAARDWSHGDLEDDMTLLLVKATGASKEAP